MRELRPVRAHRFGLRLRLAGLLLPEMRMGPVGEPERRLSRPAGRTRIGHLEMTISTRRPCLSKAVGVQIPFQFDPEILKLDLPRPGIPLPILSSLRIERIKL
jgi:hypothetical protein